MTSLLLLFIAARQTGTITFSTPAAPFDRVCAQLAKQTGLTITPGGDLREEVVALDIHDMPRPEVISRLAHVLYAKVTPKGDNWELSVDLVAARKREETALENRIQNIKRAQAAVLAQVETEGAFDAHKLLTRINNFSKEFEQPNSEDFGKGYNAFETIRRDGPGSRAIHRLISRLPADVLAQMPPGDVLIFSDHPRHYQVRLRDEAKDCIAEITADQNSWASIYQSDGKFEAKGWSYGGDPRFSTDAIDPSKVRLFLKATMDASSNLPTFQAYLATADGVALLSTNCNMESDAKPQPPAPPPAPTGEELQSLSPIAKAQVLAYRKGPYTFFDGADGAARNWILTPEKFEPLGGAVSEVLMTAAKARHKNLVACIPDEAFNLMYTFGSDKGEMWPYTASGVLATISKMSAQVEEDAGCIEIRGNGIDPRTDRAALGRLIRQEDQDGCLRLLPLVRFAGLLKSNEWNSVAWQAVDPVIPNSLETAQIPEWLPLRLLGHLTPEKIDALASGKTLRIDSLPEYVIEGIQHAFYYRPVDNLNAPFIQHRDRGRHLTLDREPTEVLPDGFWRDATVSMKSTTSLVVSAIRRDNWSTPLSMKDYAFHSLAQQNDQYKNRDRLGGDPTPTVHLGHQTQYVLVWQLSPQISISQTLTDNNFNLRAKPTSADTLPDDYQKQLLAEIAGIKKQYANYPATPTRVTNPPPAPR